MFSPTIRADLVRLSQIELACRAERGRRLSASPQTASARRGTSLLLALLHRRTMPPATDRHQDSRALGDHPFVPPRVVDGERTRLLGNQ
jgi:hypothetical protein